MDGENHRQNLLYECFEDICKIFQKHDVTFSLGDGLRPGSQAGCQRRGAVRGAEDLGRAHQEGRGVRRTGDDRGPGHIPMDRSRCRVRKEEEMCYEAPFYTLGPLVTDIAPRIRPYHLAIGAAMIGWYGASMLCYVTPKEHLGCPIART